MIDASQEQKFLLLKKRLDALHYCQPLTIESAQLAERLLNDLIKINECYHNQKKNESNLQKELIKAENYLQPLKNENQKLQKENNELHQEMIKVKEEADYKDNRWKTKEKSLLGENQDLQYVAEQKKQKMQQLQDENLNLKQKLDSFMQKVYLPSTQKGLENLPPEYINDNIQNPTNISLKKNQGIEFDQSLENGQNQLAEELFSQKKDDYKQWAESLKIADERNEQLKRQLNELQEQRAVLEEKIETSHLQIINRDNEIQRLQAKLDLGSINMDKLSGEFQLDQQVEKVERLNHQIDFLTNENTRLEEECKSQKKELTRTKTMREDNRELQKLVQDLNHKLEHAKFDLQNQDGKINNITSSIAQKYEKQNENLQKSVNEIKDQLEQKVQQVNQQTVELEQLHQENEKLKYEAEKSESVVAAYQSDKRAFKATLDQLKSTQEIGQDREQQYQEEIALKTQQISDLEDQLNALQSRVQLQQRDSSLSNKHTERLIQENKSAQDDIQKLRSQLTEIEQENLTLSNQKQDFQNEVERINQTKEYLEEQLEKARNSSYQLKGNMDSKQIEQERSDVILGGLKTDNERLKQEIDALEQLLQNSKLNYMESEKKSNDYFAQLKAQTETVKEVEKQHKITNDMLSNKIKELRSVEKFKSEIERELYELRGVKKQFEDLQLRQQQNSSSQSSLDLQKVKLGKEIDELKFDLLEKDEQLKSLKIQLDHEVKEKNRLSEKLSDIQTQSEDLSSNVNRLQEKDYQYKTVLTDLQNSKERERTLVVEKEELNSKLRQQEQVIQNSNKNVDKLVAQRAELNEEIGQLKDKLSQTSNQKSDTVSKSLHLQEKINGLEIFINDLQHNLETEQRRNTHLNDDYSLIKKENKDLQQELSDTKDKVLQLSTLAEGLDKTKEELLGRLRVQGAEKHHNEDEKVDLRKTIQSQKEKINDLENELKLNHDSLINIDQTRDQIQDELDKKCEENNELKRALDRNEVEFQKLKERCLQMQGKTDMGTQRALELERSLKENNEKIQTLMHELDNAKYTSSVKQREIEEVSNDLNVLARENQNLNGQLVKTINERDGAREQLNQNTIEDKKLKQTFRASQMEKEDILNNYKQVSLENERFHRNIQDLTHENQQLLIKVKEYERELAGLNLQLQNFQQRDGQMQADIHALERQQTFLTKRLEQEQMINQESLKEKEQLFRECENMKRVNDSMNVSRDEFQRNLAHQQNEKQFLQEQIAQLKREIESKVLQVDFEKQRAQQLEEVILRERQSQHKGEMEMENTIAQKQDFLRQIESLQQKSKNLQNYIDKLEAGKNMNDSQYDTQLMQDFQRQNDDLKKKYAEKANEVQDLLHEQRLLREQNSKLRLGYYKLESENKELTQRENISGGKQEMSSPEDDMEKYKMENEQFQREIDQVKQQEQKLKEDVQRTYNLAQQSHRDDDNEEQDN